MRILAGAGLVMGGLSARTAGGRTMALVGLVPLLTGVLDVCLLGPLFGLPVRGEAIRRQVGLIGEDSLLPHPPLYQADSPTLLH